MARCGCNSVCNCVITGAGVTGTGSVADPYVVAGQALTVQEEGVDVATGVSQIDFQGAGVTATAGAGEIIVTIPGGGGTDLGWFNVVDYGATGDGVTDDTAEIQAAIDAAETAGGGVVYFPSGVYLVGGALQDAARSNAQLLLPRRDAVDTEQVSIHLLGEFPPPPIMSVIGATPLPDGHSIIKSNLAGSGGALLGAWGPVGTFQDFTMLHVKIENLTFRMPADPGHTALDLAHVFSVEIDNVICDAGNYQVQGIAEPTTATSYGIELPTNNNGACTKLGIANVIGFYNGYAIGEHTNGEQMTAWGCKKAATFAFGYHASHIQRFMSVHCQRGLVITDDHYFEIDQFNIEHAASGWWVTAYDIDDATNKGHGTIRWHVVLAGVGVDTTFTVNGASDIRQVEIGNDFSPGSGTYGSYAAALTAATTDPTLGTAGTIDGRYTQDGVGSGSHVTADVVVQFGTSGVAAGSGTYYISVPVNMITSLAGRCAGNFYIYDASTGTLRTGAVGRVDTGKVQLILDGGSGLVSHNTPWAWAANDVILVHLDYEVA